jgi:hypothetical protein
VFLFRKSDFLFFKVLNSNMPIFFRKKTLLFVIRSLRYSGYLTNTSCVCQVAGISKSSNHTKQSLFPKKKSACYYSRLYKTKDLIFWIVTHGSARDYTVLKLSDEIKIRNLDYSWLVLHYSTFVIALWHTYYFQVHLWVEL